MKNKHIMVAKMTSLLLFTAGAAGAQTFFYSDAGSGSNAAAGGVSSNGTLASIGFDLSQWNRAGSVSADSGVNTVRPDPAGPGNPFDLNIVAPGLFSGAPSGTVLDSVTFYFYVEALSPDPGPHAFSLYDGFQASVGNFIGNLSVGQSNENTFISFTVTGAQLAGGMAITADGLPTGLLNLSSELNLDPSRLPGVSATYTPMIPEPSTALLGCLGAIALFRRRR